MKLLSIFLILSLVLCPVIGADTVFSGPVGLKNLSVSSSGVAPSSNTVASLSDFAFNMDTDEDPLSDQSGNSRTGALKAAGEPNFLSGGIVNGDYDFDGGDDYIEVDYAADLTQISFGCWININSFGGDGAGRILDKRDAGGEVIVFYTNDTGDKLQFIAVFSTTSGNWTTDTNTISTGTDIHVAFTYDGSSVSNDPVIYINGTSVNVTEGSTPVGTFNTNNDNYTIGNRKSDTARGIDGEVDEVWLRGEVVNEAFIDASMTGVDTEL